MRLTFFDHKNATMVAVGESHTAVLTQSGQVTRLLTNYSASDAFTVLFTLCCWHVLCSFCSAAQCCSETVLHYMVTALGQYVVGVGVHIWLFAVWSARPWRL